jgi:hypothetical protein
LVATIQNDNRPMWGLLKYLAAPMEQIAEGSSTVVVIELQTTEQASEPLTSTESEFVG